MQALLSLSHGSLRTLDAAAPWVSLVLLRFLIGWEFLDAGLEKYQGNNWFGDIQHKFPFPFNIIPADLSWQIATWFELAGGVALMLGVGTRFFALSLMVLTVVATAAVHWPTEWSSLAELAQGYAISDKGFGNYKLPALYMAMLIPLFFWGPGKLSVDAVICRVARPGAR